MKTALRLVASLLVVAGAAAALYEFSWLPFKYNIEEKTLQFGTVKAVEAEPALARLIARRNLDQSQLLARRYRVNANFHMIRAANYRILGVPARAEEEYKVALSMGRRPEILRNLAEVQWQQGKKEEAVESSLLAYRFDRSELLLLENPALRTAVRAELDRRGEAPPIFIQRRPRRSKLVPQQ